MTSIEAMIESIVRRVIREELATLAKSSTTGLVTIKAFAAARSISPSTVRQAIRDGRLPAVRVGRAVRIAADAELAAPVVVGRATAATERAERRLGLVPGGRR